MVDKGVEAWKDLFTEVIYMFGEGWWIMLGAGILHRSYHQIPAIGYWTGVIISIFFMGAGAARLNMMRRIKYLTGES